MKQSGVSLEAAIVARRFYIEGQQKNEVANDLGISRFKVARLLDEALASGIVKIQVAMPTDIDLPLGEKLAKKFGISKSIVVAASEVAPDATVPLLGAAGANYLSSTVKSQDVVGISWGRTLDAVIDEISDIASADVVQLVGGLQNDDIEVGGVELARRLSGKSGGKVFPLHAPMLVGSEELAEQLKKDPGLKPTIDNFKKVTIAVVGVGAWDSQKSALYSSLNSKEVSEIASEKPIGDLCASVFNEQGGLITTSALKRTIAISPEELRNVGEVIAIAGGPEKVSAIAAALKTGIIDTLVTDSVTAEKLLKLKESE